DGGFERVNLAAFCRRGESVPNRLCSSQCHKEGDLRLGGASIPGVLMSPRYLPLERRGQRLPTCLFAWNAAKAPRAACFTSGGGRRAVQARPWRSQSPARTQYTRFASRGGGTSSSTQYLPRSSRRADPDRAVIGPSLVLSRSG